MFNPQKFLRRMNEHFIATAMFNQEFAYLENAIKLFAKEGLLAGTRAAPLPVSENTLFDTMKGVRTARVTAGLPVSPYLEKAFNQLDLIRKARNRIAHSGAQFREHHTSVAKNWNELADGKPGELFNPATFRAMSDDISTITACLMMHMQDLIPADMTFRQARQDLKMSAWHEQMMRYMGVNKLLANLNISDFMRQAAEQSFQYVPRSTPQRHSSVRARRHRTFT